MIDVKELRVGNKFLGCGMIQTVFEIMDNTNRGEITQKGYENLVVPIENRNQYKPIEIDPIPLTEEWLIKFGFKEEINSEYVKFWTLKGFVIYHEYYHQDYDVFRLANQPIDGADSLPIEYTHKLQNLYYALTGEELTLEG